MDKKVFNTMMKIIEEDVIELLPKIIDVQDHMMERTCRYFTTKYEEAKRKVEDDGKN